MKQCSTHLTKIGQSPTPNLERLQQRIATEYTQKNSVIIKTEYILIKDDVFQKYEIGLIKTTHQYEQNK